MDVMIRQRVPEYKTNITNGKELKEYVKKFKDDEKVGAIIVSEQLVRNENTDDNMICENNLRFNGDKLTNEQIEKVMKKVSNWDLHYNFNFDSIEETIEELK